ncbi:alpha-galactosidase [Compostibacter hankyongensis]|uniref:Alpha-galactosidase n=1 Tax=Compostibacter hankyongensis TaxID=1007089 RepID=A0ABP8FD30_9BACT
MQQFYGYLRICIIALIFCSAGYRGGAQTPALITIRTQHTALVFRGGDAGLQQVYLGAPLSSDKAYETPGTDMPAYPTFGTDNLYSAAIRVTHADGNPSLELRYVRHTVKKLSDDVTETAIALKDPQYPFEVTRYYKAYFKEDVITQWTTIRHHEAAPVTLYDFASGALNFGAGHYWLTQFHGDWASEMQLQESELTSGIKIIDTKLGSRADMYQSSSFMLSPGRSSTETSGEVLAGTLAWSGNFRLLFELDRQNKLRLLAGMNPYASEYHLKPDTTFTTPAFIFTYSRQGKGQASRNLHRWARQYGLRDGDKSRFTLLNNWESTYFDFDENKLVQLFGEAKKIGVDLFLLDDGWFGNKYPRNNDHAGLGDWQENKKKLPQGIGYLVKEAGKQDVRFGIWVEPEMVNPKSELYEQHPEWILKLPNRPENYYRNQLVLDLSNPAVQDFVFGVVDGLMTKYPGIAYFKWDCNRMFTNAYSAYLGKQQSHLFIAYVEGLYKVFERLRKKYPHLPMMLCSGGGGRVDYGALPYFTEFWPSDNTNPMDRIFIQWGYSYFFPAIATADHVTSMGDYPLKFRLDVAMTGKLGFDMRLNGLKEEDIRFVHAAVQTYKRLEDVIWYGDLYRLVSPYQGHRAALMYANEARDHAVLFGYAMHMTRWDVNSPVRLQGLDPDRQYLVQEINLPEGKKSSCPESGRVITGKDLMEQGLHLPLHGDAGSVMLELTAR